MHLLHLLPVFFIYPSSKSLLHHSSLFSSSLSAKPRDMTRWHSSSCPGPSIVVHNETGQEGVPHCRACDKSPNLEEIVQIQNVTRGSSAQEPPPDAQIGQMRLWWPRTVPYTDNLAADTRVSESDTAPAPDAISAPPAQDDKEDLNTVYPSELESGSFRLAYLPSVESDDVPVHVDLETYPLDNCPAYEAVSYTWGGENADSSHSRPVYVGPYWDVTMQTENCWEMLRFVRPHKRGVRLVWVDAICIHQNNLAERSMQVSEMIRIFSEAMQVIVYLGPDIAARLPPGKYPRRRRLHELDLGRSHDRPQGTRESSLDAQKISTLNLQGLLERRYFSRLWVVQELLLSARATIRIGDVDFWTNADSTKRQGDPEDGHLYPLSLRETAAPWLMHISRGFLMDGVGQILPQIMALTSSTHCTDPRDQLFGVLDLIEQDENELALQADYSLSLQHVYIGLFAHLLLCGRLWALLVHHASGPAESGSNSLHRPSWMPDWKSRTVMRSFWASVAVSTWSAHPTHDDWLKSMEVNHQRTPKHAQVTRFSVRYEPMAFGFGKAQPPSNLQLDRRTGAITGDIIRLVTIPSQPVLVASRQNNSMNIFKVVHRGHSILLYSRYQLDKLVQISNDDIYLVDQFRSRDWPGYLILRRLTPGLSPSARQERSFIACCELVLFDFDSIDLPEMGADVSIGLSGLPVERWLFKQSSYHDVEAFVKLKRGPFAWALPTVLKRAQAFNTLFRSNMPTNASHSPVFHGVNRPLQALAVYQTLLDEILPGISPSPARDFKDAYYLCFDPSLCPAVGEFFLGLALPQDIWDQYHRKTQGRFTPFYGESICSFYTMQTLPEDVKNDLQHEIAWAQPEKSSNWWIVFDLGMLRNHMLGSREMELVYLLRQVSRRTGISEEELLERDPEDLDSRVLVPVNPWSQALVDDFGCDPMLDKISIV